MLKFALIGEKLGHSYSKAIHERLGEEYKLVELDPSELAEFLAKREFAGLNVTIPYKKAVIPYLDELTEVAAKIGAVNTIYQGKDGKLIGTNTDITGFGYMTERAQIDFESRKVLILGGSGGAGRMVKVFAEQAGAMRVDVASRSAVAGKVPAGIVSYDDLPGDTQIIVNATPVGMYPHVAEIPICIEDFQELEGVVDLIYNPLHTALVQRAQKAGAKVAGGISMLVKQAVDAASLFQGSDLTESTETILRELVQDIENIVLVGMPGSGKTAIGKRVAKSLKREFVDIDNRIADEQGKRPGDIINEKGEGLFRELETEMIMRIAKEHSQVIATGGGSILREENTDALRQNGRIFFIDRDLGKLSTKGRPLSQNGGLEKLYKERMPLYLGCADECIKNNDASFTSVVRDICNRYA